VSELQRQRCKNLQRQRCKNLQRTLVTGNGQPSFFFDHEMYTQCIVTHFDCTTCSNYMQIYAGVLTTFVTQGTIYLQASISGLILFYVRYYEWVGW
jgi:hypothetical protein